MFNETSILSPTKIPLSIRTPTEAERHIFNELGLGGLLSMKSVYSAGQLNELNMMGFYTADAAEIRHRLDVFDDLMRLPAVRALFEAILPIINDISDLTQKRTGHSEENHDLLEQLYYVRRLQFYVDVIEQAHAALEGADIRAEGLRNFAANIRAEVENEPFQNLQANLNKLKLEIRETQSITVGINLNKAMRPESMGILSVNTHRFTAGTMLNRLLQSNFNVSAENQFMSPLVPVTKGLKLEQQLIVIDAFNAAFNTTLRQSMKGVRVPINTYMKECSRFLVALLDEITFLTAGCAFLLRLKEKGAPLCKPEISETPHARLSGVYSPHLLNQHAADEIVYNNIEFDENGMIYVLTGANSGGKTVFLQSLGIAQVLFQLGLPVPARTAVLAPVDQIYIHFPAESTLQGSAGRLEQECATLSRALKTITPGSLVLMDETFSTTGAYDGAVLAESVLRHLSRIGCKCVFSTHIHELANRVGGLTVTMKIEKYFEISRESAAQLIKTTANMRPQKSGDNNFQQTKVFLIDEYAVLKMRNMHIRNVATEDTELKHLERLACTLLDLHAKGVNVVPILAFQSNSGDGYIIQPRAKGAEVYDRHRMTEKGYVLRRVEELSKAPQTHYDKFVADTIRLIDAGVLVDFAGKDNFFYDKEIGFQFIDINAHDDFEYGLSDEKPDAAQIAQFCCFLPCYYDTVPQHRDTVSGIMSQLTDEEHANLKSFNQIIFVKCKDALLNSGITEEAINETMADEFFSQIRQWERSHV